MPLASASGRILAETIASPRNVPADDNAAVDGYAYAHADYDGGRRRSSPSRRASPPATPPLPRICPERPARIFTGAVMPEGADTVAMQEDCEAHVQDGRDFVAIPPGLKRGANRRKAGEDLAEGAVVAAAGHAAQAAGDRRDRLDRAATASPSSGRLRVALVSTGDEIVRPGAALGAGPGLRFQPFPARRASARRWTARR